MKEEVMNLEESQERCTEEFGRRKGKGELFNYIILSKVKEIILRVRI